MAARGKSGGAGFGQRPRRAGGESQAVQVSASVPEGAGGESPTVQTLAAVAETHDGLTTP